MKTFVVNGFGWSQNIKVDDSIFFKSSEQALEAMTLSLERYIKGDVIPVDEPHGLGAVVTAYEPQDENNEHLYHYALSEYILRNAGRHDLADKMKCWSRGGEAL